MEPAPEVADALRSAGLPVDSCERQLREPYWVRVHWTRSATHNEKELASEIKQRIKQGLDPMPPAHKKKPKPTQREQLRTAIEARVIDQSPSLPPAPPPMPPKPPAKGKPGRALQSRTVASPAELAGMRLLGTEVIRQAFADAFNQKQNTQAITDIERDQALSFLTAEHGAWAGARQMWCALADLDPDALRDAAMRHLRNGTVVEFPSRCGPKFGPRASSH